MVTLDHNYYGQGNVCCVNLGGEAEKNKRWYPADLLEIAPWQMFPDKLPERYNADMVKFTERYPGRHLAEIRGFALPLLGIGIQPSFLRVSF